MGNNLCRFDNVYRERHQLLAGMDEAGRGPIAGPVTASAVTFISGTESELVKDSKKMTALRREKAYDWITAHAHSWSVYSAGLRSIKKLNILGAVMHAMECAADRLAQPKAFYLIDGNRVPEKLKLCSEAVIKGDDRSFSIAAASIIAKVTRDRIMLRWGELFPGYGLEKHKGYGTAEHIRAVREKLPLPVHRLDFEPLKSYNFPLKPDHKLLGTWGENHALYYLVVEGYKIIGRNIHGGRDGEIDIMCRKGEEFIAVEVKTTFGFSSDYALERVTEQKIKKLMKAVEYYFYHLNMNEYDVRFDVVTVSGDNWRHPTIDHYKNVLD